MTLPEVLWFFDSVEFDQPYYPDQPGTVKCCGLPVVMRGGGARVECSRCHRAVSIVGRQWVLTEDGKRGIPIRFEVKAGPAWRTPNPESRMRMLDFIDEFEWKGGETSEIFSQASEEHVRRKRGRV